MILTTVRYYTCKYKTPTTWIDDYHFLWILIKLYIKTENPTWPSNFFFFNFIRQSIEKIHAWIYRVAVSIAMIRREKKENIKRKRRWNEPVKGKSKRVLYYRRAYRHSQSFSDRVFGKVSQKIKRGKKKRISLYLNWQA